MKDKEHETNGEEYELNIATSIECEEYKTLSLKAVEGEGEGRTLFYCNLELSEIMHEAPCGNNLLKCIHPNYIREFKADLISYLSEITHSDHLKKGTDRINIEIDVASSELLALEKAFPNL